MATLRLRLGMESHKVPYKEGVDLLARIGAELNAGKEVVVEESDLLVLARIGREAQGMINFGMDLRFKHLTRAERLKHEKLAYSRRKVGA